jgi:hypothetical protein
LRGDFFRGSGASRTVYGWEVTWFLLEKQVAAIAADFLDGKADPLTAIRRIFRILDDVDRFNDSDIQALAEIDRATAHLPDAEQRMLWDPAALAAKDIEIEEHFRRMGPRLRELCQHLVAKWG